MLTEQFFSFFYPAILMLQDKLIAHQVFENKSVSPQHADACEIIAIYPAVYGFINALKPFHHHAHGLAANAHPAGFTQNHDQLRYIFFTVLLITKNLHIPDQTVFQIDLKMVDKFRTGKTGLHGLPAKI